MNLISFTTIEYKNISPNQILKFGITNLGGKKNGSYFYGYIILKSGHTIYTDRTIIEKIKERLSDKFITTLCLENNQHYERKTLC
jgi:hypothetical protein